MAGRQLNSFRLIALAAAIAASVLMLLSSQLSWLNVALSIDLTFEGLTLHPNQSGGLSSSSVQVIIVAALIVLALAAASLIPYLRFLCVAVVIIGGTCIAYALALIHEIGQPIGGNIVSQTAIQASPGIGIYVLIAGGTLAVISAVLTLLTPRTAGARYQYGVASYTPVGPPMVPRWSQEMAGEAAIGVPVPASEKRLESVGGAKPKNLVLYCALGLLIPGLPSLLIRDHKVIGVIQLGIWALSWVLLMLVPLIIGFLPWLALVIWSGITGYGDAQRWNRRHGFII